MVAFVKLSLIIQQPMSRRKSLRSRLMQNPAFRENPPPSILRFSCLPACTPVILSSPRPPSLHIIVQVFVQPLPCVYRYPGLCPPLLSSRRSGSSTCDPIPSYTCSAPQPASASLDNHQTSQPSNSRCNEKLQDRCRTYLMFAGGSILGTNSRAIYAIPMTAVMTPGAMWYHFAPIMTQPMKR